MNNDEIKAINDDYSNEMGYLFGDKETWFMIGCFIFGIGCLVLAGYLIYQLFV